MKKLINRIILFTSYTAIIFACGYIFRGSYTIAYSVRLQPIEAPVMVQDNFPVRDTEELTIASDNKEFNLLFEDFNKLIKEDLWMRKGKKRY